MDEPSDEVAGLEAGAELAPTPASAPDLADPSSDSRDAERASRPKPFDTTGKDLLPLKPAEEFLLAQLRAGGYADLSDRKKGEREVRAEFLRALLLGLPGPKDDDWRLALSRIHISGADITGEFDLISLRRRLHEDRPLPHLGLYDCDIEGAINIQGARFERLAINYCRVPAVRAWGLQVDGDLSLRGSVIADEVSMESARIAGNFDADLLRAAGVDLLFARIAQTLTLSGCDVGERGVSINSAELNYFHARPLTGSRGPWRIGDEARSLPPVEDYQPTISGPLDATALRAEEVALRGLRIRNPRGDALLLSRARLSSALFLGAKGRVEDGDRVELEGHVSLSGLHLGSYSSIRGCDFRRSADDANTVSPAAHGVCLDLREMKADGRFELAECSYNGAVTLEGARIKELVFDRSAWPPEGQLDIEQLEYDAIELPDHGRILHPRHTVHDWIARTHRLRALISHEEPALAVRPVADRRTANPKRRRKPPGFFSAQPYEQLSRTLRRAGYGADADKVALAKRRERVKCKADGVWARQFARLMDLTSHYGFSSIRALTTVIVIVALGGAGVAGLIAADLIQFAPRETLSLSQAPAVTYSLLPDARALAVTGVPADWLSRLPSTAVSAPHGCPSLNPGLYALDLAVPILDLGQESACRMETSGWRGGLAQAGLALYQIIAAIMTALFLTTLTGVLRRD